MTKTDQSKNKTMRDRQRRMKRFWRVTGLALVAAAVATEFSKPKADRTWVGKLGGAVPYDLRKPTATRAHERWWNSSDHRIFVPKVFGVGWTVNFRTVVDRLPAAF
jgi:Family of unknown function (DUF5808)